MGNVFQTENILQRDRAESLKLFGLSFFSIGKLFKLMTLILSVLSNTPRGMSYRIGNRILAIEAWDLLTAIL